MCACVVAIVAGQVFDVCVAKSFETLDNWKNEFLTQASVGGADHFPFIVLGNKVDMEDRRAVRFCLILLYNYILAF